MARRTRIHYPGAVYHVMARGVDGREIYLDNRDRELFLSILSRLRRETNFSLLAYCLMGNHFHLAMKVSGIPLSTVLQRLLTSYALTFNAKHGRTGHLFQARYKANLCLDDRYLLGLVRYIHLNPVRAHLVVDPSEWSWSSHGAYLGKSGSLEIDRIPLLEALSDRDYSGLMNGGRALEFDPWPQEQESPPLLSRADQQAALPLEAIAERISVESGISIDEIRSRGRLKTVAAARKRLLRSGIEHGHSITIIARWLGCTPGTAHVLLYGRNNQIHQKPDP